MVELSQKRGEVMLEDVQVGCGATQKQEVRAAAGSSILAQIYRRVLLTHIRPESFLFDVILES